MKEIIEKYYRQEHSALSEEDIEEQNCIHTPDEIIEFALSVVKNCSIPDVSLSLTDSEEEYEPYFGWCNVEGCEREGANGGGCWRDTGYWTVCSKHSQEYREGKPQPPMKQWAIDREKRRGADGVLVNKV